MTQRKCWSGQSKHNIEEITKQQFSQCVHFTWFDLDGAPVSAGLSLTVSYSQGEAILPLHQVSQKQHCLVVRVVQYVLLEKKTKTVFKPL